jgi:hypothetical protein
MLRELYLSTLFTTVRLINCPPIESGEGKDCTRYLLPTQRNRRSRLGTVFTSARLSLYVRPDGNT